MELGRDTLDCDGWERAAAWKWILSELDRAHIPIILPDLKHNDEVVIYTQPYSTSMASLLHREPRVRALAFIGYAIGAHKVCEQRIREQL